MSESDYREKNEIFRKKFELYIADSAEKGRLKRHYFNQDMIISMRMSYEKLKKSNELIVLTGDEFSEMPPTIAGWRSFSGNMALVYRERDIIRAYLGDENTSGEKSAALAAAVRDLLPVIERVLADIFAAAGTDEEGNPTGDNESRKQAEDRFLESSRAYYEIMQENKRTVGKNIMLELSQGLEKDLDPADPGEDKQLLEVCSGCDSSLTERLRKSSHDARIEGAKRTSKRESLRKIVEKSIAALDEKDNRRFLLTRSFSDYAYETEMSLRELLYIQRAAWVCAVCTDKDTAVDRIIADHYDKDWGIAPKLLDDDMPVNGLPGFIPVRDLPQDPDCGELRDLSDFERVGAVLQGYLHDNYAQFDSQHLTSVFTGIEDLPRIMANARELRNTIDRMTANGYGKDLDADSQKKIFDLWVLSTNMCRIGYTIMEFIEEYEESTVGDATDAMRKILDDISFTYQVRSTREPLKQIITKRF